MSCGKNLIAHDCQVAYGFKGSIKNNKVAYGRELTEIAQFKNEGCKSVYSVANIQCKPDLTFT